MGFGGGCWRVGGGRALSKREGARVRTGERTPTEREDSYEGRASVYLVDCFSCISTQLGLSQTSGRFVKFVQIFIRSICQGKAGPKKI